MDKVLKIMKGTAASPGIAIGPVFLFNREDVEVPHYAISESSVDSEIARFQAALKKTKTELKKIKEISERKMTEDHARIFQAHLLLLEDPLFVDEVPLEIKRSKVNAEFAVSKVSNDLIQQLSQIDDEYISGRTIDIYDVVKRVLHNLLDKERASLLPSLSSEMIVIAHDLCPASTALMDKKYVLGFATDVGTRTSHTAIMARALEIPAVVGVNGITANVEVGDLVIIDGNSGEVLINPDEKLIQEYEAKQKQFLEFDSSLESFRSLPAVTLDNFPVALAGNIEIPEEVDSVLAHGARGIGLYRTEFLYIREKQMPTEDEQYEYYLDAAKKIAPDPVIIRTVDLGGDKFATYMGLDDGRSVSRRAR